MIRPPHSASPAPPQTARKQSAYTLISKLAPTLPANGSPLVLHFRPIRQSCLLMRRASALPPAPTRHSHRPNRRRSLLCALSHLLRVCFLNSKWRIKIRVKPDYTARNSVSCLPAHNSYWRNWNNQWTNADWLIDHLPSR